MDSVSEPLVSTNELDILDSRLANQVAKIEENNENFGTP